MVHEQSIHIGRVHTRVACRGPVCLSEREAVLRLVRPRRIVFHCQSTLGAEDVTVPMFYHGIASATMAQGKAKGAGLGDCGIAGRNGDYETLG